MNKKELEKYGEDMAAFDYGLHQNVVQYHLTLKRHGYTIEDAFKFVEITNKVLAKEREKIEKHQPKCPTCGSLMPMYSVNDKPENQTGDPRDKSVSVCQNPECRETIYNRQSVQAILKKLARKMEKE